MGLKAVGVTCSFLAREKEQSCKAQDVAAKSAVFPGARFLASESYVVALAQVKDWAAKVAALEAEEVELEKRLQALQENKRQKREAVVKEERCQQDACRCSPGKRRMHQPRSPEAQKPRRMRPARRWHLTWPQILGLSLHAQPCNLAQPW